jgi:hypothetical protein
MLDLVAGERRQSVRLGCPACSSAWTRARKAWDEQRGMTQQYQDVQSTGEGPKRSPLERPQVRPVHDRVIQVQQVRPPQLGREGGVQAGPDASSVQFRSRRHAVIPEQPTDSVATSRQATPVRSTYGMPRSAARSDIRHTQLPGVGAAREQAATAEPRAPTGRPEQDQHAQRHLSAKITRRESSGPTHADVPVSTPQRRSQTKRNASLREKRPLAIVPVG